MTQVIFASTLVALLATAACAPTTLTTATAERVGDNVIVTHAQGGSSAAAQLMASDACSRIGRTARMLRQEVQATGAKSIFECDAAGSLVATPALDDRIVFTQRPGDEAGGMRYASEECSRRGQSARLVGSEVVGVNTSRVIFQCVGLTPVSAAAAPQERVLVEFGPGEDVGAGRLASDECGRFRKRARMAQQEMLSPIMSRAIYDCVTN